MATLIVPDNGFNYTPTPGAHHSEGWQEWDLKTLFPSMAIGDVLRFTWNPPPGVNRVSVCKSSSNANADTLNIFASPDGTNFHAAPAADLAQARANIATAATLVVASGVVVTPFARWELTVATSVPASLRVLCQVYHV